MILGKFVPGTLRQKSNRRTEVEDRINVNGKLLDHLRFSDDDIATMPEKEGQFRKQRNSLNEEGKEGGIE